MNKFKHTPKRQNITAKISRLSIVFSILAMAIFLSALILANNSVKVSSQDITPPIITGAKDMTIYIGEAPAYRKNVSASDDSGENVELKIDSTQVNLSEPGRYPITYIATDASGNSSSVTVYLTVEIYFPKEAELTEALDKVISKIILPTMSTEEKIRAVYAYVQSNITFVDTSDKSNWKAEAYKSLFITNTGDCFSFFAASKAFFERLGIESLDIQRPAELAQKMNQTHYWSLVNISDDPQKDIWYHYDSCRLRAEYNHSGCLLTEIQINAYNYVRENFYAYNTNLFPKTCDTIITPTPELEEFYNKNRD